MDSVGAVSGSRIAQEAASHNCSGCLRRLHAHRARLLDCGRRSSAFETARALIDRDSSVAPGPDECTTTEAQLGPGLGLKWWAGTIVRGMQPSIGAITLAVSDLDASLAFYRDGLGLPTSGITGTQFTGSETEPDGRVAMFNLAGGLILSLYPATELAKDAGLPLAAVQGHGFSIGHMVDSRDEVDSVLASAEAAGGKIVGRVRDRPWGIYSGYFTDLDGHLWEVLHFPAQP